MRVFFRDLGDNLSGAWAVMRGRPEGLARLDLSVEGFWRSFGAIVLVLPFAVLAWLSQSMFPPAPGESPAELTGAAITLQGIGLLVDWLAFPLVFAVLARPVGLSGRYVPFIVTRNWATVLISAGVAAVHALHLLGLLSSDLVPLLLLVAFGVNLRFAYVIARIALQAPISLALPIVVFDLVLSLTIWAAINRFA